MDIFKLIGNKYSFIKNDIRDKGLFRFIAENGYEWWVKKKFKKMGIVHQDFIENLHSTIAKSIYKDAHENQPSSYYRISRGLKKTGLPFGEISILDIGCGGGKVLNFCMLMKVKQVTGLDLDEAALEKARKNSLQLKNCDYSTPFDIVQSDAGIYKIPKGINTFYLFNPFGEKTMRSVLDNIMNFATTSASDIYIIYVNPKHQDLLIPYKQCRKIFENFYKKPGHADTAVFRIGAKK